MTRGGRAQDFFISYWCIACALAVASHKSRSVLCWNARLLLGLTFALATLWKVTTGDFGDGTFMEYELLTDRRLSGLASLVGGIDPGVLAENRSVVALMIDFPRRGVVGPLQSGATLRSMAMILSYWTLAIEGLLALGFLAIGRTWLVARFRNHLLIAFILSTYFLLPVVGFAFVLCVLGYAQCREDSGLRWAYLVTLLLVQFTLAPINEMMTAVAPVR